MVLFPERAGEEFDWFAFDEAGQVAVFATAGSGPVHAQVPLEASIHDAVGDRIEVSGWGTNAVWDSYARVGLYAYDWDGQQNCYRRVAEPFLAVTEELSAHLGAAALPRLSLSFRGSTTIAVEVA